MESFRYATRHGRNEADAGQITAQVRVRALREDKGMTSIEANSHVSYLQVPLQLTGTATINPSDVFVTVRTREC